MIESVPLIQNANDAQQINASIIAMKKASKELDEKILKLNNLNKELDKKIAVLDSGLAQEITDRENADSAEVTNRNTAITNAVNALDVASVGGSGKYISAISETDGKINATVSDLTSVIESGNNQPATSGGVADAIQGVISLPTDAVLHYSFDDVPDYPDGTADVKLLDNNTYNIQSTNYRFEVNGTATTITNSNGNVQFSGTIGAGGIWDGVFIRNQYTNNKILKVKMNITALSGTVSVWSGTDNKIATYDKVGEYVLSFVNTSSASAKNVYFVIDRNCSATVVIEQIYIGDGSYSIPIIDNADGQFNSVSVQNFVSDKGVSGKSVMFMGLSAKTIEVDYPSERWDAPYTVTCWAKKENSAIYFVGWDNIYGIQNHLIFYSNDLHTIWFDVNENTRFIGYLCDVTLEDNKWYHFAFINKFESGKSEIWINGVKQTLRTQSRTVSVVENKFLIGNSLGSNGYNTNYKNSVIDDFQVFDRALSDTEIQALYQNKANTPKYFPIPINEIKEGSLELATSNAVAKALNNQFINITSNNASATINGDTGTAVSITFVVPSGYKVIGYNGFVTSGPAGAVNMYSMNFGDLMGKTGTFSLPIYFRNYTSSAKTVSINVSLLCAKIS